jgi:hypothetical protein
MRFKDISVDYFKKNKPIYPNDGSKIINIYPLAQQFHTVSLTLK